jgi:hypothetical protein
MASGAASVSSVFVSAGGRTRPPADSGETDRGRVVTNVRASKDLARRPFRKITALEAVEKRLLDLGLLSDRIE